MGSPLVTIIVLNYNGERWLRACLESVEQTSYQNFRVIVVDNCSTDQSPEIVREEYPSVELIRSGENGGFSAGNNLGITRALEFGSEYLLLLNPDTRVEPEWLDELVAVAECGPGIAGAVQLRYDDDRLNEWTSTAFPGLRAELEDPKRARDWISVGWVEGACMLIRGELLDEVGWLDPIFFSFYEEIDLCRRARAHGFEIALVPRSRIHHHRGGSWEATPAKRLERDRVCDYSQFIYELTDPQRSGFANLRSSLRTFATKLKESLVEQRWRRIIDLLGLQLSLLADARRIGRKWSTDRARLEAFQSRAHTEERRRRDYG